MKRNGSGDLRRREPITDSKLLLLITICIFVGMYILAMLIWGGGYLKPQMLFDILNDNAFLIIISCGLTIVMITMVWKRIIPLKSTAARILATLCNPMMLPGLIGNLLALLPWPLNQLDHGTESFGHALVLILGLILLKAMESSGEVDCIEVPT
jgi:ribose/xylose/arabinose/galactoside ABC-type transport system permease subunit